MIGLVWIERALLVVAGVAVLTMMVFMTLDATGRYFFNRPIPAGYEIVELLMATIVCAAVPVVTIRRQHIIVDLFTGAVPQALRGVLSIATSAVCLCITLGYAWTLWQRGRFLGFGHETTLGLGIPQMWIAYLMSMAWVLCAAAFVLVTFSELRALLRGELRS